MEVNLLRDFSIAKEIPDIKNKIIIIIIPEIFKANVKRSSQNLSHM